MRFFCTYFDSNYLPRGLALYHSLRAHCPAFRLSVLCLDTPCYDALARLVLPDITPIRLEDFERDDPALLGAKQNRTRVEYYFTCTPSLPLYVLAHWPEVDLVTYLDADLCFFADPEPLYQALNDASIALTAHNFPPALRGLEVHGRYNVGWLSFRRDEQGLACLHWWRERCLEWCYDRVEGDRYADQKYLDAWPERFSRTVVLNHPGANVAPWNLGERRVTWHSGTTLIDGAPLIFYHVQGLKQPAPTLYVANLVNYRVRPTRGVMEYIYAPTIRLLAGVARGRLAGNDERVRQSARGRALLLYRNLLAHDCLFVRAGRLMWLDWRFRFVDLGAPSDIA